MNTTPFAISRFADAPKPIPRVRADRGWVELERSEQPIEPMWKSIMGAVCWIVLSAAGFWIADILAKVWGL